jgi:hypothetical protein
MNVARSSGVRNIRELERSRWLIAVLVLYLGMAVGYSLTVPIFETPDEPAHFLYANDLAAGDGLPILDYSESPKEYHQPPLYYWLVAGVMRWFDTDGYKQFTVRNPHAAISDASTFGNKNAYLHDPRREGWPFKGLSLAVHMGRLVSIGLGMVTVWATYSLALKFFSRGDADPGASQAGLAAAAASVVAFNPQFLFISGALNNDNAVTALSSVALWATVTYYDRPRSVRWLVALGGLSGLAILTKTTGLAVIALILGVVAAKAVRQRLIRMLWLDAGIVVLLAALIGGWWYVRNALLYADPLLSRYIHRWLSDEVAAPRTAIEILRRFEQGEISFWGTFGWLNITWGEWIYKLLRTWTRLSGLGLLVLGVRWLIHRSPLGIGKHVQVIISPLMAILAWTGLVAATLTQWILVSGGLQGRLLFPAISALAVLLVAGWTSLVPRRWGLVAVAIPAVGLALLAIATPFVTISPAYARPKILPSTDLPPDATAVDLTYAGRVKLIGYHVSPFPTHRSPLEKEDLQAGVRPGDWVDVTLYWQALESIHNDFSVFIHLFGRDRQRIGTIDTYPGLGNFPTSQWETGEVIRDVYPIRIAPDAAAPTLVTASVGWYDFHGSREGIHALDSSGQPTTTAGTFKLTPQIWPEPKPTHRLSANFDDTITLLGYDIQLEAEAKNLNITFYWRCDAPPTANLTVFAHLVDTNGNIVAQMDKPPLNGDYPTSAWEPGEVIRDNLTMPLSPAELPQNEAQPNELWLRVGLYRSDNDARLPVFDATGQVIADAVISPDPVTLP